MSAKQRRSANDMRNGTEVIVHELSKLSAEQLQAFFCELEKTISPDEIRALQIGISYFRILRDDKLRAAMKTALAETLYDYFRDENNKAEKRIRQSAACEL